MNWNKDLCVATIADASFAQETQEGAPDSGEPHRSQGARLIVLTNDGADVAEVIRFHPIAFLSKTLKRVCAKTLTLETYNISAAVERGDIVPAKQPLRVQG